MAQIQLIKHAIPLMSNKRGQSNITFNSNPVVGKVPLLKLFNVYSGSNDYFRAHDSHRTSDYIRNQVHFKQTHGIVNAKKDLRRHGFRNNPRCTVSTTMLSILGIQGSIEYLYSKGIRQRAWRSNVKRTILVNNPVDVFILAMIEPSDLRKIEDDGNYLKFDSSLITLYLSENKWKNRNFLTDNYNGTLNKYLRASVKEFVNQYEVKTEVVPDAILETYHSNPHSIESNSISEIMEIDKSIKSKVFSTINTKLLVDI